MRVSVALCTFQGERYLAEQLDSIASQDVPVDEVVVSDDGSTDATLEVLAEAAQRHPGLHMRVLPALPQRLGVTRNFERAIGETAGDIVLLSDQDDVWHPDRVSSTLAALDAEPQVSLVHSDAVLIDADGRELPGTLLDRLGVRPAVREALQSGHAIDELLKRNLVTGATTGFRRSVLATALPFPPAWLHDEWLAIVAAEHGGLRLLPRQLMDYRLHGDNQIGAEETTLSLRLARLTAPRGPRNSRLLDRSRQLVERFPSGSFAAVARDKLGHEEARSAYPARRIRRVGAIWRELRTGRYRRFGGGSQDVLRDLVQPA